MANIIQRLLTWMTIPLQHHTGVIRTGNRAMLFSTVTFTFLLGMGTALNNVLHAHAPDEAASTVQVMVQTINPENVRVWSSFSARMKAVDYAEIRPEVSGRITEVRISDGQIVKAGQILFVIDPRSYEAAVAKAEANMASATTNANFTKIQFERTKNLIKKQAIPQSEYDQRANSNRLAHDAILAADAELKEAKINLDRAYVKAPIEGRVGRPEITLGNLVQAGPGAPVLTSIVSNHGIYADFEVDEQTYMKSIHNYADTQDKEKNIPVELIVKDDEEHPYKGKIYSFDNHIDSGSGTIRARAKFANKKGRLVPGMFVSIRLASSSDSKVLLVPKSAIGSDQNKHFVYIITEDSKVVYREVTLGEPANGQRIVKSGLQAGDRVVVDRLQDIKPGLLVKTQEAPLETYTAHTQSANPI